MKKIGVIIIVLLISNSVFSQEYNSFGKKINSKSTKNVNELLVNADQNKIKVMAEVESVCQVKGCWMKVKLENGESMRVTFKDYGFFVPKNLAGQKVIFEGKPEIKTTSVEELRHYAKDAGKNEAEINAISKPKTELTFVADGVLVPATK
jgi:hypothetical protein